MKITLKFYLFAFDQKNQLIQNIISSNLQNYAILKKFSPIKKSPLKLIFAKYVKQMLQLILQIIVFLQSLSLKMFYEELFFLQENSPPVLQIDSMRKIIQLKSNIDTVMPQDNYRLRKSLLTLNLTQKGRLQRKRYFWCMKMLDVLPPFSQQHKLWTFRSPARNLDRDRAVVKPVCLHDVLLSSHATACQHKTLYFAHYHRHFLINFQLFINFANEVLMKGLEYLKTVYPQSQYKQLYNDVQKWNIVFKAYEQFKNQGLPTQISAHYWNPCNYKNDQDLILPIQLKQKKDVDQVDNLCMTVRNSYAWNVNVSKRWIKGFDQKPISLKGVYTGDKSDKPKEPKKYSQQQERIKDGKDGPRNHKKQLDSYNVDLWNWLYINRTEIQFTQINKYCQNSMGKQKKQSELLFPVNNISDQWLKAAYFSQKNDLQYINLKEQIDDFGGDQTAVNKYNEMAPHYSFAKAYGVYNKQTRKTMSQYLIGRYNINQPHDVMHMQFGTMMNDNAYSASSLIFFCYHSWVDLMLQFKIRQSNQYEKGDITLYDSLKYRGLQHNFFVQNPNSDLQSLLRQHLNKQSISKSPDLKIAYWYPIPQWLNPNIRSQKHIVSHSDISIGFFAGDYILQGQKPLDSRRINNVYSHFVKWHQGQNKGGIDDSFAKFKGFSTFNFNYNYEVYDYNGKLPTSYILDDSGRLPTYILDIIQNSHIKDQIQLSKFTMQFIQAQAEKLITRDVQKQTNLLSAPPPTLLLLKKEEQSQRIQKQTIQTKIKKSKISNQELNIRKLLPSQIQLYVRHKSNLRNGLYPIKVKFNHILTDLLKIISQNQIECYQQNQIEGFFIRYITIFGKERNAQICHKCVNDKILFIPLQNEFQLNYLKIWQLIQDKSLNQTFYDSLQPNKQLKSLKNFLLFQISQDFQAKLLSGAEELQINVISQLNRESQQYVRINAQSYSVKKGQVETIHSKKRYTFNAQFDFYKTFDVSCNNQDKTNDFDKFFFKKVTITIGSGAQFLEFSFEIPNFSRLLRLNCIISETKDNKLAVVVQDADYDLKKQYYREFGDIRLNSKKIEQ